MLGFQVGPSVAYDAASMNELRKWNEQYGEGGSRRKSPFGFWEKLQWMDKFDELIFGERKHKLPDKSYSVP